MAAPYPSARDRLGQTVSGKYMLDAVLGAGGTATVYRARTKDGTGVALKLLHHHLCRSGEVCRRFMREGYLGNVLEHPGVVRVLDDGTTDDGCAFLVLELLEGQSLEQLSERKGGRLPYPDVLDLMDQLLDVLETAHARNIVHRDIKPSNLFLTSVGRLKVLDFGIARVVDDGSVTATKTGQMVGTPAFMPPEQALSRPRDVDTRTDLWAVGATMFTLLSGEFVHVAESSSEHLVKAATLQARSVAKALPGIPANVEALIAKALAFDKSDRWQSAQDMRAELARVKRDPGRRVGTSTTPPPRRSPSSDAPTFIGVPDSERSLGIAMSMSGEHRPHRGPTTIPPKRNGLVLGLGIASVVLAFATAGLAVTLMTRTPARVADRPAHVTFGTRPAPAPPPPPATETVPVQPAPVPHAAPQPPSPAKAVRPPAGVPHKSPPASSVDVYRPF
jgi:serine/threonine-protein kinase